MPSKLLTTGQAAKLCSVTPDTVLKWIHAGKLPARKTAGRHHRIDRNDLNSFLARNGDTEGAEQKEPSDDKTLHYCWEYNGKGKLLESCRRCVVYRLRAHRCYEAIRLADADGHNKVFCEESCDNCEYFQVVHERSTSVLVVTGDSNLARSLQSNAGFAPFELKVADGEYECSAQLETYRPDYVIIDCALGDRTSRDICNHIVRDPRIPFAKVVMATEQSHLPRGCDSRLFAQIEKPLRIRELVSLIRGYGPPVS